MTLRSPTPTREPSILNLWRTFGVCPSRAAATPTPLVPGTPPAPPTRPILRADPALTSCRAVPDLPGGAPSVGGEALEQLTGVLHPGQGGGMHLLAAMQHREPAVRLHDRDRHLLR